MFSNDVIRNKNHNKSLRAILKECRCNFNKVDCRLEDKINMLLRKYFIKPKVVLEEN